MVDLLELQQQQIQNFIGRYIMYLIVHEFLRNY